MRVHGNLGLSTQVLQPTLVYYFGVFYFILFSVDLTFSRAMPQLVDYVQYMYVIGQTTLDDLNNIEILARTCPI